MVKYLPDDVQSCTLVVDGLICDCREKLIGSDFFRYFVRGAEFPFCSVGKPDESGSMAAYCLDNRLDLGDEFNHEDVIRWALSLIKESDTLYYQQLTHREQ